MSQRYPRLGEQITRLTRSLVAAKSWDKKYTMAYVGQQTGYSRDMVYRWQQGRACPSPETIEMLAQIGKKEANLPREWGESLLNAARYPDPVTLINKLWGPKELRIIPCNLPTPEHTQLIGRKKEIADLLELLSSQYAAHLISVDGIGGVGKTALVLEVAYRCLWASTGEAPDPTIPTFDAIIFVSAKQQYLTPVGLLPYSEAQRTLRDIFREIAQTLNRFEITQATLEDQPLKVRDALSRQRALLIVDNLETMVEKQEILAFLYRLPPQVKVVMTTREQALFSPVRLDQLEEEEALNLMKKEAQEKHVALSDEQASILYQRIGGIPAALVFSIGQIASGFSVKTVLDRVLKTNGDVARFCFEVSVGPLREYQAHKLLMAMAMFPKLPVREAVAHTAGLTADPNAVEDGLAQLQQLSLASQQAGQYRMLPLTREYALTELAAHPEFEREARRRWVEWYSHLTEEYGGNDWKEWHIPYNRLEEEWENLLAVFDWCAAHGRYDEIRAFWEGGRVLVFAGIYGYWNDRLIWLNWLIEAAERRGDWPIAVEAMRDQGFILTLTRHLKEADLYFRRAWDIREHVNLQVQIELIQDIAQLSLYQGRYSDAHSLLDQARILLDTAQLDKPEWARRWITDRYYHGLVCYEERDYDQAESYFREVIKQAHETGWQRAIIYAQNYLADISIAQDRLDEAESLLKTGWPVSERNKDKRRTAHYKRSFAYLRQKQGDRDEAARWAREALDGFDRLGMQLEAKEMQELLQVLQA